MLNNIRQRFQTLKHWIKERATGLTVFGAATAIIGGLPNWHGIVLWWWEAARWIIPRLGSTWGRVCLIAFGIALIWLDHRRVLKKRERRYDPTSLKGRALKLRDEMQAFLDNAPAATKPSKEMTDEEILDTAFTDPRPPKLRHGYHLLFEDRVMTIYHELGERNIEEHRLIRTGFIREEDYVDVIQVLTGLSERPEVGN
jgi:hypothetical protein